MMKTFAFAMTVICLVVSSALSQPNSPYGEDPYGEGAYGEGASDAQAVAQEQQVSGRAAVDAILADPATTQAELAKHPDLKKRIANIAKASSSERSAWQSRQVTSRTRLVKALEKQLGLELSAMNSVATGEKAEETVATIEDYTEWFNRKMAYTTARAKQQRAETLRAGRSNRDQEGAGGAPYRRSTRSRTRAGSDEQPDYDAGAVPERSADEIEFEAEVNQWLQTTATDNGQLCLTENEKILNEYGFIYLKAEEEEAVKSKALVAALILLRNQRVLDVQAALEKRRERAAQDPVAAGDTGTRGRRTRRR